MCYICFSGAQHEFVDLPVAGQRGQTAAADPRVAPVADSLGV